MLRRSRDRVAQMFDGERTIEVNVHHADLLAMGIEIIDRGAAGLEDRAHADDDAFGILSAVVVEEFIFAAGQLADLAHVFFHNGGELIVEGVRRFACLEENIRVLSRTAGHGVVR